MGASGETGYVCTAQGNFRSPEEKKEPDGAAVERLVDAEADADGNPKENRGEVVCSL